MEIVIKIIFEYPINNSTCFVLTAIYLYLLAVCLPKELLRNLPKKRRKKLKKAFKKLIKYLDKILKTITSTFR